MLQVVNNPTTQKSATAANAAAPTAQTVPTSVLDNLAARFRPGGLCLLQLLLQTLEMCQ